MSFDVYLKDDIGNQVNYILSGDFKKFNVSTLNFTNGLLKTGTYYLPVEHILFIKEV